MKYHCCFSLGIAKASNAWMASMLVVAVPDDEVVTGLVDPNLVALLGFPISQKLLLRARHPQAPSDTLRGDRSRSIAL